MPVFTEVGTNGDIVTRARTAPIDAELELMAIDGVAALWQVFAFRVLG